MVVRQKIVFGGDCRKRPTVQMSFRSQISTVYLVSEHLTKTRKYQKWYVIYVFRVTSLEQLSVAEFSGE